MFCYERLFMRKKTIYFTYFVYTYPSFNITDLKTKNEERIDKGGVNFHKKSCCVVKFFPKKRCGTNL